VKLFRKEGLDRTQRIGSSKKKKKRGGKERLCWGKEFGKKKGKSSGSTARTTGTNESRKRKKLGPTIIPSYEKSDRAAHDTTTHGNSKWGLV